MPPKFRHCTHCRRRTVHELHGDKLRCSQCVPIQLTEQVQPKSADGAGLIAALRLCGAYPHAANCFFIHVLKVVLKIILFVVVFADVFKRGFLVSGVVVAIGFFAIDCFGPRGREKIIAVEFGKRFWTTIVKY